MRLLIDKLQNEKDLYAKRLSEGRKDLIATMLLRRIEQEIKRLEREIKDAKRKNEPTRERTSGFVCCIFQVVIFVFHVEKGLLQLSEGL